MKFLVIVFSMLVGWAGNVIAEEMPVPARHLDPLESQKGKVYTLPKIRLADIVVSDGDLLSAEEVNRTVAPWKGKDISFEQLEQIRQELTRIIIGKGYVNSGVIIPDQEVKNGVVRFQVIHGQLSSVVVEGNRHFSTCYLKSKLQRGTRPTLNITPLQENLQLLQLNPNVERINAELLPGQSPGESVLKTRILERNPFSLRLESSNSDPPPTGSYRGDIYASYSNLFGTGDIIEGRVGITEGNLDYGARAAIPFNSFDTTFEIYFRRGENSVIEQDFRDLQIESIENTYGIRLSQPFIIDISHRLGLSLALDYRTSTTSLLGRRFSFSEGADDGESKVTVIRFGQEYLNRDIDHVLALNSTMSFGIDAFDSTIHLDSNLPDGRFFTWLGQFLYLYQLPKAQLVFRTDMQLSNDPLLSLEKFSIGGINSVRGYRRSLFVRDNGVSGTIEGRVPLFYGPRGEPVFSVIPFYDFGYSWNDSGATFTRGDFIDSLGGGFRWSPLPGVDVQFFYGQALRQVDVTGKDPQDYGIHFDVSWQIL